MKRDALGAALVQALSTAVVGCAVLAGSGAYIAAGLVLFLLTFVVNAMARASVAGKDTR